MTTLRTAGSVEPYADLSLKRLIDGGELPGPRLEVSSPYLEGRGGRFVQVHGVSGPAEARAFVRYRAGQGITSVKLYTKLSRAVWKDGSDMIPPGCRSRSRGCRPYRSAAAGPDHCPFRA